MVYLMDRTVAYQVTGSLNTISWCFEHEKWINSYHLRGGCDTRSKLTENFELDNLKLRVILRIHIYTSRCLQKGGFYEGFIMFFFYHFLG